MAIAHESIHDNIGAAGSYGSDDLMRAVRKSAHPPHHLRCYSLGAAACGGSRDIGHVDNNNGTGIKADSGGDCVWPERRHVVYADALTRDATLSVEDIKTKSA